MMKFNQTSRELRLIDDLAAVFWPMQFQVKSDRLNTRSPGEPTGRGGGKKTYKCSNSYTWWTVEVIWDIHRGTVEMEKAILGQTELNKPQNYDSVFHYFFLFYCLSHNVPVFPVLSSSSEDHECDVWMDPNRHWRFPWTFMYYQTWTHPKRFVHYFDLRQDICKTNTIFESLPCTTVLAAQSPGWHLFQTWPITLGHHGTFLSVFVHKSNQNIKIATHPKQNTKLWYKERFSLNSSVMLQKHT